VLKRVSWPGIIVVAGSTAYSWFTASPQVAPGERAAGPTATSAAAGDEASAAVLSSLKLHDWSAKTPPYGGPDRNIFTFRRPAPKATPAPPPLAAGLLAGGDGRTAAPVIFKLVGVAEDQDGATRTAIISGHGQLYMVKEGETLDRIHRVIRVSGDSVELLDTTDGDPRTLFLK